MAGKAAIARQSKGQVLDVELLSPMIITVDDSPEPKKRKVEKGLN